MYGKIFRQMFKGTLAKTGPWQAVVTFQQMIVLADRDGIVDMTADAISRETTIPIEIIEAGIVALELPDPDSRSPDEEGRRIIRLSDSRRWGWRIVNYEHYRKLRSEEERTEYHRKYWREKRSPRTQPAQQVLNTTQHTQQESIHAVSSKQYAESKKQKKKEEKRQMARKLARRRCPSDFSITEDLKSWAEANCPEVDLERETATFRDYEFRTAKSDWPATWRVWMRKAKGPAKPKLTWKPPVEEDATNEVR